MGRIKRDAWHCDLCGWEWLPDSSAVPERCPNRDCRSRKWNSGAISKDEAVNRLEKAQSDLDAMVDKAIGLAAAKAGSSPVRPTKGTESRPAPHPESQQRAKIDSLRSMIAGIESQQQACVPRLEPEPEADVTPVCGAEFCGKQLRGVANRLGIRWACADPSCTMFGREQKAKP